MGKDIFISYKNDGIGNNFAARLTDDLTENGYSVYFNSHEKNRRGSDCFPDRLRKEIESCTDFILIVTTECMNQLIRNEKIDWIREELLTARINKKNIIPLLVEGAEMPKDKSSMPESLEFLPDLDAILMPEQYIESPYKSLTSKLYSEPRPFDQLEDILDDEVDFEKSIEELTIKATNGDTEALYYLANCYYYDLQGIGRNYLKAFELLKQIIEINDGSEYYFQACTMLGRMYHDGTGNEKSNKQSYEYHKIGAERNPYSSSRLSYMISHDMIQDFNYDDIIKYYTDAINKGDDIAKNDFAEFYMKYGKFSEAEKIYRSMGANNPQSEYSLGMLYKDGKLSDPPKPDYYRAFTHFSNAANMSGVQSARAANEIGNLYFNGPGDFRQDFSLAQEYYIKSASKGNTRSLYMLGYMYEYGYVEKDLKKAVKYFEEAVEKGDVNSLHHLAALYQEPEIKNYKKAVHYAQLSAKNGVVEGLFIYANLLYIGRGCASNPMEAKRLLKKAKKKNMFQADMMLKLIEENENGKS